jgi:hypothetical protein
MLRALGGPGGVTRVQVDPPLVVVRMARQTSRPQRTSPMTYPVVAVAKLAAWAKNPIDAGNVVVVVGAVVGGVSVVVVVRLEPIVVGGATVVGGASVVEVVRGGAALGGVALEQPARVAAATIATDDTARARIHPPCGSAS